MKYFGMVALLGCLIATAGCASRFSLQGGEVQYRDRGLGKNQPMDAAGAYAVTKNADTGGYVRTKEVDTYALCVDRLTKAGERFPAQQCSKNGGWGYGGYNGYGGGYPQVPFPTTDGGSPWGRVFPSGIGAPTGGDMRRHRVVLKNASHSLFLRIEVGGKVLVPRLPPREEVWTFVPYNQRPQSGQTVEECHIFHLAWMSSTTGQPLRRQRRELCFQPFRNGNRRDLRPPHPL